MSRSFQGRLARRDQRVELRHPGGVPVAGARVDREHPRGLAHAHLVLARERPVDVAGQGGEVGDPLHVGLVVEDRLVQVGDAPALRHGEVEERGQLGAGLAGDVVAPGAERHQQLASTSRATYPCIIPLKPMAATVVELHGVAGAHVLDQRGVAGGQALPDIVDVVGPDAVLELVLPGVRARRQRRCIRRDEGRLDAGRAELDPEERATRPDQLRRTASVAGSPDPPRHVGRMPAAAGTRFPARSRRQDRACASSGGLAATGTRSAAGSMPACALAIAATASRAMAFSAASPGIAAPGERTVARPPGRAGISAGRRPRPRKSPR